MSCLFLSVCLCPLRAEAEVLKKGVILSKTSLRLSAHPIAFISWGIPFCEIGQKRRRGGVEQTDTPLCGVALAQLTGILASKRTSERPEVVPAALGEPAWSRAQIHRPLFPSSPSETSRGVPLTSFSQLTCLSFTLRFSGQRQADPNHCAQNTHFTNPGQRAHWQGE